MAARSIKVEGVNETARRIEAFGRGMGARYVRPILHDASEIIATAVRSAVPVRTGAMRQAVGGDVARRQDRLAAYVSYTSGGRAQPYFYIAEAGARAHGIEGRNGKMLPIGKGWVRGVSHPGMKGIRAFRRGLSSSRAQAESFLVSAVRDLAVEAARKAGLDN